jgi:succinyl-CoA synthetase beta subunit
MFTKGMEFLIGLQKTADFGHVVAFGVGGSDVEKLKKVDFRVCPFEKQDALELINENFEYLSTENKKILVEILIKCCKLAKKFSNIKELDINPLVISKGKGIILDSRIVFESR